MEMPDNRNDQARAHFLAGESAEAMCIKPELKCCQKSGTSATNRNDKHKKIA
jgi:hypothetical protein